MLLPSLRLDPLVETLNGNAGRKNQPSPYWTEPPSFYQGEKVSTVGRAAPPPSTCDCLKQLDRVAGRIVEQNLLSTGTGDHIVSEAHACPSVQRR